jgi:hypothetical protein
MGIYKAVELWSNNELFIINLASAAGGREHRIPHLLKAMTLVVVVKLNLTKKIKTIKPFEK